MPGELEADQVARGRRGQELGVTKCPLWAKLRAQSAEELYARSVLEWQTSGRISARTVTIPRQGNRPENIDVQIKHEFRAENSPCSRKSHRIHSAALQCSAATHRRKSRPARNSLCRGQRPGLEHGTSCGSRPLPSYTPPRQPGCTPGHRHRSRSLPGAGHQRPSRSQGPGLSACMTGPVHPGQWRRQPCRGAGQGYPPEPGWGSPCPMASSRLYPRDWPSRQRSDCPCTGLGGPGRPWVQWWWGLSWWLML